MSHGSLKRQLSSSKDVENRKQCKDETAHSVTQNRIGLSAGERKGTLRIYAKKLFQNFLIYRRDLKHE